MAGGYRGVARRGRGGGPTGRGASAGESRSSRGGRGLLGTRGRGGRRGSTLSSTLGRWHRGRGRGCTAPRVAAPHALLRRAGRARPDAKAATASVQRTTRLIRLSDGRMYRVMGSGAARKLQAVGVPDLGGPASRGLKRLGSRLGLGLQWRRPGFASPRFGVGINSNIGSISSAAALRARALASFRSPRGMASAFSPTAVAGGLGLWRRNIFRRSASLLSPAAVGGALGLASSAEGAVGPARAGSSSLKRRRSSPLLRLRPPGLRIPPKVGPAAGPGGARMALTSKSIRPRGYCSQYCLTGSCDAHDQGWSCPQIHDPSKVTSAPCSQYLSTSGLNSFPPAPDHPMAGPFLLSTCRPPSC